LSRDATREETPQGDVASEYSIPLGGYMQMKAGGWLQRNVGRRSQGVSCRTTRTPSSTGDRTTV